MFDLYLLSDNPDHIGQLLDHEVDTLNAGLLEPADLFLDNGLERHVGREQAHSDTCEVCVGEGVLYGNCTNNLRLGYSLNYFEGPTQ